MREKERERLRKSEKFGRAQRGGRGAWMRDWLQVVGCTRVRGGIRNMPLRQRPGEGHSLAFPLLGCSLSNLRGVKLP